MRSEPRSRLLGDVAARLTAAIRAGNGGTRVAVDGVDGAGKTVFADELADELRAGGQQVVRVSADGFHRPRVERHRRGRDSAEGFWQDTYDRSALRAHVIEPFGPGGSRRYRDAVHDLVSDQPLERPVQEAPAGAVLVLDGLFLHRDELVACWEFSVFLQVPFEISVARMAARDGSHPDPAHPGNARYVGGQERYFAACSPLRRADLVVDNSTSPPRGSSGSTTSPGLTRRRDPVRPPM